MKSKLLVIEVAHGLGNRLRALASAAAVAAASGRILRVVWTPDIHCNCRFTDLFEDDIRQISDSTEAITLKRRSDYYCYVDHQKTANLAFDLLECQHEILYVKSQKVLHTRRSFWNEENTFLRSLTPTTVVTKRVGAIACNSETVGVHVRELAGQGNCSHPADDPSLWDDVGKEQMFHWRAKTTRHAFRTRMESILELDNRQVYYVAADDPSVLTDMSKWFVGRIKHQQRSSYSRDAGALVEAMVDLYALSRCGYLLGSEWSSFTELAIRLGGMKAELAGVHFP